ncbi:AEC family transporter [Kineococcus gynurae]|uniref:AEC family transporter n=1 Tax=Kineococcus gynurae TaxID=452979 RepID=A0ABV5LRE3_9ACTN
MSGVLTGFAVVGLIVAVGYVLGRSGVLGAGAQPMLSRLVFFVGTPALMLHTIAAADVGVLLSDQLVVTLAGVGVCLLLWLPAARFWLRLRREGVVIGGLASCYVNAGNIGLPVAAYVLGDLTAVLPTLLLQQILLSPVALGTLDLSRPPAPGTPRFSLRRLLAPLANPVLVLSMLGLVLSLTGVPLPRPVEQPLELLGGLAVPGALLAFGMSLHGRDAAGWRRKEVVVAATIKTFAQPAAAFVVARYVLGLDDAAVFAATVIAALPTAQNIFTYAVRYRAAEELARDTVLVTTVAAGPVMIALSLLLPH